MHQRDGELSGVQKATSITAEQQHQQNENLNQTQNSKQNSSRMSSGTFVDRIDPFAKRSLKKKSRKSQGSSRYQDSKDLELQQLPPLKCKYTTSMTSRGVDHSLVPLISRSDKENN